MYAGMKLRSQRIEQAFHREELRKRRERKRRLTREELAAWVARRKRHKVPRVASRVRRILNAKTR